MYEALFEIWSNFHQVAIPHNKKVAYLVVVSQKLVQEINGCIRDKALVLRGDKFAPWLARISAENLVILNIQLQVVLLQVSKQLVSAQNAGNLDKLIVVVVSVEERLLAENLRYEFNTMNDRVNLRLCSKCSLFREASDRLCAS